MGYLQIPGQSGCRQLPTLVIVLQNTTEHYRTLQNTTEHYSMFDEGAR
jgi:hypothetical protein